MAKTTTETWPSCWQKLTADVMKFLNQTRIRDSSLRTDDLVKVVKEDFRVPVPRSIERQLSRQKWTLTAMRASDAVMAA